MKAYKYDDVKSRKKIDTTSFDEVTRLFYAPLHSYYIIIMWKYHTTISRVGFTIWNVTKNDGNEYLIQDLL